MPIAGDQDNQRIKEEGVIANKKQTNELERKRILSRILRKVIDAGGPMDWTVWEIRRYAEELSRHTLEQLDKMSGEDIKRIIEREIEKVYRLRPRI